MVLEWLLFFFLVFLVGSKGFDSGFIRSLLPSPVRPAQRTLSGFLVQRGWRERTLKAKPSRGELFDGQVLLCCGADLGAPVVLLGCFLAGSGCLIHCRW